MKPKAKPVTDPLDRMLQYHKQSCAMHTYSLQEKRHCSCGRDKAVEEVARLRKFEQDYKARQEPLFTRPPEV